MKLYSGSIQQFFFLIYTLIFNLYRRVKNLLYQPEKYKLSDNQLGDMSVAKLCPQQNSPSLSSSKEASIVSIKILKC